VEGWGGWRTAAHPAGGGGEGEGGGGDGGCDCGCGDCCCCGGCSGSVPAAQGRIKGV
jgi:hypothetical protein